MGNNLYNDCAADGLQPLRLAVDDATLMARMLQEGGYIVTRLLDATLSDLHDTMAAFAAAVPSEDGTVVVYFAGYGVCEEGVNYLLPVNATVAGG